MHARERTFLIALAVLALPACGDDPPKPPEACSAIPLQELYVGEETTVAACFNDPQGEVLSYTATSVDPDVAMASTSNDTVTITALQPGNTTITVTATNLANLSATTDVEVLVPNRAPTVVRKLDPQRLAIDEELRFRVSDLFEDPDMEVLTYEASSSDGAIVVTEMISDTLVVGGIQPGRATVTVTATDPGGETAELSAVVTVGSETLLLFDNFDEDTGDWDNLRGGYRVEDGYLTLWSIGADLGVMSQELDADAWRVEATIQFEQAFPGLIILNDHPKYQAYLMLVSPDRPRIGTNDTINVSLFVFHSGLGWITYRNWRTRSDDVKPGIDLDITFEVKNRDIICRVEGKQVIRIENAEFFTPRMTHFWLAADGESLTEAMFKSVRLYGTARDDATDVSTALPKVFSPRLFRMPR